MRLLLRISALLLLAGIVLPAFAVDEPKKPDAKKPPGNKGEGDKKPVEKKEPENVEVGRFTGKLVGIDESNHKIKLQVSFPELNPGEVQAIANDQAELQRVALTERNFQTRARRIMELQQSIARHQMNLYKKSHKDIDLQTAEVVKVRWLMPPAKFDEKGRITRHTAEELKELKGDDPKVPGFSADFSDLRDNQTIQVLVMRKKGAPKPPQHPAPKGGPAKNDVEKALALEAMAAAAAEYAPFVSMIVIVADAPVR